MSSIAKESNASESDLLKQRISKAIEEEYDKFYNLKIKGQDYQVAPLNSEKPKLMMMKRSEGNDLVFCFKDKCNFDEIYGAFPRIFLDDDNTLNSIVLGDFSNKNHRDYNKIFYTKPSVIFNKKPILEEDKFDEFYLKLQEINIKRIKKVLQIIIKLTKDHSSALNTKPGQLI